MAQIDVEKLRQEIKKMIIGYSAMWGAVFSTLTAITISVLIGIRSADMIVEVSLDSIKLLSYVIKFITLWF